MAEITAGMVKELREKTDAPMMECKKALTEADGDMAKAEELLRVKLGNKASKAASRVTAEGIVSASSIDGSVGAMRRSQLRDRLRREERRFPAVREAGRRSHRPQQPRRCRRRCSALPLDGKTVDETPGRAGRQDRREPRDPPLRALRDVGASWPATCTASRIGVLVEFDAADEQVGKDIAMHVAASKPVTVSKDDVPAEKIEAERKVFTAQAAESGKPAEIVAKMVEGRVQKYLAEVALLGPAVRQGRTSTVEKMLKAKSARVNGFTLYVVGEGIEKRTDDFAAEVAAQVAAAQK